MTSLEHGVEAVMDAMERAKLGIKGKTIFETKLPVMESLSLGGEYLIKVLNTRSAGGNNATWKTHMAIAIYSMADDTTVYQVTDKLRRALQEIPRLDARVPKVTMTGLEQLDDDQMETRVAVWQIEVVIIDLKEG